MTTNIDRFTFGLATEYTIKLQRLANIRTAQEGKRVKETTLIREWVEQALENKWKDMVSKEQSAEIMKILRGE